LREALRPVQLAQANDSKCPVSAVLLDSGDFLFVAGKKL
jgi:hypothetical protein